MPSQNKKLYAIGTMSGTSFDGVDAALIKTDGQHYIEYITSSYIKYSDEERDLYFNSFLKNYKKITKIINNKHILAIKNILANNSKRVDLIGLHGQTFSHNPIEKWTWQYINAKLISDKFKLKVISDFRIADINFGGEGAPLVPVFHKNLAIKEKIPVPCAVLNIGGISNVSIIKNKNTVIGFDIGPGNGPIDSIIRKRLQLRMDKNGSIARNGKINKLVKEKTLLLIKNSLNNNSYDRSILDKKCLLFLDDLTIEDALATIIDLISDLVHIKTKKYNIQSMIITGGGRKNLTLINAIKNKLGSRTCVAEDIGWDGDSLEAQAFAYLAVRSIFGMEYTYEKTTGIKKKISGGILNNFIGY